MSINFHRFFMRFGIRFYVAIHVTSLSKDPTASIEAVIQIFLSSNKGFCFGVLVLFEKDVSMVIYVVSNVPKRELK